MFLSKKLLPIIFFSALAIIFSVPASAQTYRSYCWPQKQCKDKGGQYARTKEAEGECMPNYGFCYAKQTPYDLQIRIGETKTITGFAQYVEIVYKYLIGIVSIIAIVMIMVGGLRWLTAGGNSGAITQAKQIMSNAVIGLVLTLGSYTLLQTINPALTKLTLPPLKMIAPESASQWCPSEINGKATKYECGKNYTKAENSELPIRSGSCVGSFCAEAGLGCFKIGDILGSTDSEVQMLKAIAPTHPTHLCSFKAMGDFCLKARGALDDACKKLSYSECKALQWSSLDLIVAKKIEKALGISSIGGSVCQFEGALSIGTCKADLKTVGSICTKLTQKYKSEKAFNDVIGTDETAGTK